MSDVQGALSVLLNQRDWSRLLLKYLLNLIDDYKCDRQALRGFRGTREFKMSSNNSIRIY